MKAFAHFCTITKHKKLVLKECFRVGLYKQGLLHDMSKYSWTEFRVGCRYYQGTRSPNNAEREEKGYSSALQQVKCISGMHIPLMHRLLIMKTDVQMS